MFREFHTPEVIKNMNMMALSFLIYISFSAIYNFCHNSDFLQVAIVDFRKVR